MSLRSDLYQGKNDVDFRPVWKKTLPVAASLIVASLVMLVTFGLDLSIDFDGGGIFEVPVDDDVSIADARDAVSLPEARIQTVEDLDGNRFIRVQTTSADLDSSDAIVASLAELGGGTPDDVSVNTVGPTWGDQITDRAIRAVVFFVIAVSIYLAWRLEWRMAVGALVAVLHDLVLTAGVYSVFRFEVSPATVIALLTIMGYSIYDTVVVYDKVYENAEDTTKTRNGYTAMVNDSMNQVLMRSINTTITTVLPVLSMLVLGGLFGGGSLRDFALALFIGLLLGTYSSLFVAAPLLAWLKERWVPAS
ncbi:MAG: preprotein translocase subunit SecF [Acidimicrobiales bacterium]